MSAFTWLPTPPSNVPESKEVGCKWAMAYITVKTVNPINYFSIQVSNDKADWTDVALGIERNEEAFSILPVHGIGIAMPGISFSVDVAGWKYMRARTSEEGVNASYTLLPR